MENQSTDQSEYLLNVQPILESARMEGQIGQVGIIDTENGPVTVIFMEEGASTIMAQGGTNPFNTMLNDPRIEISIVEGEPNTQLMPPVFNSFSDTHVDLNQSVKSNVSDTLVGLNQSRKSNDSDILVDLNQSGKSNVSVHFDNPINHADRISQQNSQPVNHAIQLLRSDTVTPFVRSTLSINKTTSLLQSTDFNKGIVLSPMACSSSFNADVKYAELVDKNDTVLNSGSVGKAVLGTEPIKENGNDMVGEDIKRLGHPNMNNEELGGETGNKTKLKCLFCQNTFFSAEDRKSHFITKHAPYRYCQHCPYTEIESEEDYCAHMSKDHYICCQCNQTLETDDEYREHLKTHMTIMHKYKCTLCTQGFDKVDLLLKHRAKDHTHSVKETIVDLKSELASHGGFGKHLTACETSEKWVKVGQYLPRGSRKKYAQSHAECYCNTCKRWFLNISALDSHRMRVHRKVKTPHFSRIKGFKCLYLHRLTDSEFEKLKLLFAQNRFWNVNYFVKEKELTLAKTSMSNPLLLDKRKKRGKIYQCLYCHQCFHEYSQVKTHVSVHRTVCSDCGKRTGHSSRLRCHRLNVHGSKRDAIHECLSCKKTFGAKPELLYHMKSHVGPWICERESCSATFTERKELVSHRKEHGNLAPNQGMALFDGTVRDADLEGLTLETINNYIEKTNTFTETTVGRVLALAKCKICREQFYNASITRKHIKMTHMKDGSEKFQCQHCDFSTHFGYDFKRHNKKHSRAFLCNTCGKSYDTETKLTKHMLQHEKDIYQCFYCSKQFGTKQKCIDHISEIHSNERQQEDTKPEAAASMCVEDPDTGEPKPEAFQLETTADVFTHEDAGNGQQFSELLHQEIQSKQDGGKLGEEMGVVEPKKEVSKPESHTQPSSDKKMSVPFDLEAFAPICENYKCSVCLQEFRFEAEFREHTKQLHAYGKSCTVCQRDFSSSCKLNYHMLVKHCVGMPLTCPVCKEQFLKERAYWRHAQKHSGKFSCRICANKSFSSRMDLVRHIQNLHQALAYPCVVCGNISKTYDQLVVHKLNVHGIKVKKSRKSRKYNANGGTDNTNRENKSELYTAVTDIGDDGVTDTDSNDQTEKEASKSTITITPQIIEVPNSDVTLELYADGTILTKDKQGSNFSKIHLESLGIDLNTLEGETNIELVIVQTNGTEVKATIQAQIEKCSDLSQESGCYQENEKSSIQTDVHTNIKNEMLVDFEKTVDQNEERPYKCSKCPRTFKFQNNYKCHVLVHDRSMTFTCKLCHRVFAKPKNLVTHMKLHQRRSGKEIEQQPEKKKKRDLACDHCGKVFLTRGKLNRHVRSVHEMAGLSACPFCEKKFKTPFAVERHMKVHVGPFNCTFCSEVFSSNKDLTNHLNLEHEFRSYICSICKGAQRTKLNLMAHVKKEHGTTEQGRAFIDKMKTFRCKECDMGFEKTSHLNRHTLTHVGKKEVCQICNARYTKTWKLLDHIRAKHRAMLKYECATCEDDFLTEDQLVFHEKRYHKKNYACFVCELKYKDYSDYSNHCFEKHGEGYQCKICSRAFQSNIGLKRHVQKDHANSVQCPLCIRFFSKGADLKQHMNEEHGEEPELSLEADDVSRLDFKSADETRIRRPRGRPPGKKGGLKKVVSVNRNQGKASLKKLISADDKTKLKKRVGRPSKKSKSEHFTKKKEISKNDEMLSFLGLNFNLGKTSACKMDSVKSKSHKCSVCGKRFNRESTLKKHAVTHNEAIESDKDEHIMKHDNTLPLIYKCDHCDNRYAKKMGLISHVRWKHPDVNQPSGDILDVTYETESVESVETGKAEHEYRSSKDLLKSRKKNDVDESGIEQKDIHGEYPCLKCQAVFKTYKGILRHNNLRHPDKPVMSSVESPSKVSTSGRLIKKTHKTLDQIQCEICFKQFSLETFLLKHMIKKHQQQSDDQTKSFEPEKGGSWCRFCKRMYTNLGSHLYQKHRDYYYEKNEVKSEMSKSDSETNDDKDTDALPEIGVKKRLKQTAKYKETKGLSKTDRTDKRIAHNRFLLGKPGSNKGSPIKQEDMKEFNKRGELLICGLCDKVFPDEDSIQTHLKQHKSKQSSKAGTSQLKHKNLDRVPNKKTAKTETLMMSCNICNESFSSKKLLLTHMLNHTSIKSSGADESTSTKKDPEMKAKARGRPPKLVKKGMNVTAKAKMMTEVKARPRGRPPKQVKRKFNVIDETKEMTDSRAVKKRKIALGLRLKSGIAKSAGDKNKQKGTARIMKERKAILCKKCKRSFKNRHDMQLHIIEVHKKVPVSAKHRYCSDCKLLFKLNTQLDQHNKDVHWKQCNECGENFRTLKGLKMHERMKHAEPFVIEYTGIRQECLMCLQCRKLYRSEIEYKEHLLVFHSGVQSVVAEDVKEGEVFPEIKSEKMDDEMYVNQAVKEPEAGSESYNKSIIHCEICKESFQTCDDKNKHMKIEHNDTLGENVVNTGTAFDGDNTELADVAKSEVHPVSCIVANVDTSVMDLNKLFSMPIITLGRLGSAVEYTDGSKLSVQLSDTLETNVDEDSLDTLETTKDQHLDVTGITSSVANEDGDHVEDATNSLKEVMMVSCDQVNTNDENVSTGVQNTETKSVDQSRDVINDALDICDNVNQHGVNVSRIMINTEGDSVPQTIYCKKEAMVDRFDNENGSGMKMLNTEADSFDESSEERQVYTDKEEANIVKELTGQDGQRNIEREDASVVKEQTSQEGQINIEREDANVVKELTSQEGQIYIAREEENVVKELTSQEGQINIEKEETNVVKEQTSQEGQINIEREEANVVKQQASQEGQINIEREEANVVKDLRSQEGQNIH